MVWAFQGANMMQWHERRHASPRNMTGFWMWVSGSGLTQPTKSRNGASCHTKSKSFCFFSAGAYTQLYLGLKKTPQQIKSTTTMSQESVWSLSTVLDSWKGAGHCCEASMSSSMALNTSGLHVSGLFPEFFSILFPWTMRKVLTSALTSLPGRLLTHLCRVFAPGSLPRKCGGSCASYGLWEWGYTWPGAFRGLVVQGESQD